MSMRGIRLRQFMAMIQSETRVCVDWPYGKRNGYGTIRYKGKPWSTHRLSFHLTYGEIPSSIGVLHSCDNPACLNPEHLFLGDNRRNIQDAAIKGRLARGERVACSKLTESDVRAMRELRKQGVKYSPIAKQFGVHWATAYRAIKGENWKWVK